MVPGETATLTLRPREDPEQTDLLIEKALVDLWRTSQLLLFLLFLHLFLNLFGVMAPVLLLFLLLPVDLLIQSPGDRTEIEGGMMQTGKEDDTEEEEKGRGGKEKDTFLLT